jgi:hypothetical protein
VTLNERFAGTDIDEFVWERTGFAVRCSTDSVWEVSADSDGPVEVCKPNPESDAKTLASHYPESSFAD